MGNVIKKLAIGLAVGARFSVVQERWSFPSFSR